MPSPWDKKEYLTSGLSAEEVAESRAANGENRMPSFFGRKRGTYSFRRFDSPSMRILLLTALLTILDGEIILGYGVISALFLIFLMIVFLDFVNIRILASLNGDIDQQGVNVLRQGIFTRVRCHELVIGDLVQLETGDAIPADGAVMESFSLTVEESFLTGSFSPVEKKTFYDRASSYQVRYPVNRVFAGSVVTGGSGCFRVENIGRDTAMCRSGVVPFEIWSPQEKAPLADWLRRLRKWISFLGLSTGGLTFAALILNGILTGTLRQTPVQWLVTILASSALLAVTTRYWVPIVRNVAEMRHWHFSLVALPQVVMVYGLGFSGGVLLLAGFTGLLPDRIAEWMNPQTFRYFLEYMLIALAVVVLTRPGAPGRCIEFLWLYGMRNMAGKSIFIRGPRAVGCIGAVTVVCTDKTGYFTRDGMRVAELYLNGVDSRMAALAMTVNSTAHLNIDQSDAVHVTGDSLEGALLMFLRDRGIDGDSLRQSFRMEKRWSFSPEKKFMATLGSEETFGRVFWVKGDPETLLAHCSNRFSSEGIRAFDGESLKQLEMQLRDCRRQGQQPLGFAVLIHPGAQECRGSGLPDNLTFLGFVGIETPIPPEVPRAIEECSLAGVKVILMTGDSLENACEIARSCQVLPPDYALEFSGRELAMTGAEFSWLNDDAALAAAGKIRVLGCCRPEDKLRLVSMLRKRGEIVAVTCSGAADAAVCGQADIGIMLSNSWASAFRVGADLRFCPGTSFAGVAEAIRQGRIVRGNLRRYLLCLFSMNFSLLVLLPIGALSGRLPAFTSVQLLWALLLFQLAELLVLIAEKWEKRNVILNLEVLRSEEMLRRDFFFDWLRPAIFQLVFLLAMAWAGWRFMAVSSLKFSTVFFVLTISLYVCNLFQKKDLNGNGQRRLTVATVGIFGFLLLVLFLPIQYIGRFLGMAPIPLVEWGRCILLLIFVELGCVLVGRKWRLFPFFS